MKSLNKRNYNPNDIPKILNKFCSSWYPTYFKIHNYKFALVHGTIIPIIVNKFNQVCKPDILRSLNTNLHWFR